MRSYQCNLASTLQNKSHINLVNVLENKKLPYRQILHLCEEASAHYSDSSSRTVVPNRGGIPPQRGIS